MQNKLNSVEKMQDMPDKKKNASVSSKELYMRLLNYVKPYWKVFSVALFSMVLFAATEPLLPAIMKPMLDGSFIEGDPFLTQWIPYFLVGIFAIRGLISYVSSISMGWLTGRLIMDLRGEMFSHLITLPNNFFDGTTSGKLMSKFSYDVSNVTDAATSVITVIVKDTVAIIGLLGWMFYLNFYLSLIFFLSVPFIIATVKIINIRLRNLSRLQQWAMGEMNSIAQESIEGQQVIKIFDGYKYENNRYKDIINWVRRYNFKSHSVDSINVPIVQLVSAISLAIIVHIAIQDTHTGHMTIGGFVSFFGAMAMLFSPVKRLTGIAPPLQRGLAAAESIFTLLDTPSEQAAISSKNIISTDGNIKFNDINFSYKNNYPALSNINFTITSGESVALVGPSGSGKSTIAKLITRLYDPDSGHITIDGENINNISLSSLRKQISVVSQEPTLFNDTIASNIAYGQRKYYSDAQIQEAARHAYALDFINNLEKGFETRIGQRGLILSGGQRQRIAIARAFLFNRPILILDEATSALDTESEKMIQYSLDELQHEKTCMIIAHRLSTIKKSDRIIVLDKGTISETGTHQDLISKKGLYFSLYNHQHGN